MTHELMESELILNPDGSIYHLNLLPEEIAHTIILVGDPNRVKLVSRYFDRIEFEKSKREFVTHTGYIGKKRISVVGTGIGGGNIDIALNELDALVNIDFHRREIKKEHVALRFVRLGTSGGLIESVPVDSYLISSFGLGLDGLLSYYEWENNADENELLAQCREQFALLKTVASMYAAAGSSELIHLFSHHHVGQTGITLTCPGFYGAQQRQLRARLEDNNIFNLARKIQYHNDVITNLEMETAAIYGLARILGHEACSISAIVANRETGAFSKDPEKTIDGLIQKTLELL